MSNSLPSPDRPEAVAVFPPAMMLAPATLAQARARLLAITDGLPIVHLDRADLLDATRPLPPVPPGGVVVADHVLWAAPADQIARLVATLEPGQALLFLEPTADIGWRSFAHRVLFGLGRWAWQRLFSHHFAADVPSELRRTGIVLGDTVRFNIGPAGIGSYVYGRAERID